MRLKEKNLLKKFAATLKKFSAQGAKKVEYGTLCSNGLLRGFSVNTLECKYNHMNTVNISFTVLPVP